MYEKRIRIEKCRRPVRMFGLFSLRVTSLPCDAGPDGATSGAICKFFQIIFGHEKLMDIG